MSGCTSLQLLYLVHVNLVDGGVGRGGGDAAPLRHVPGPDIADQLPPPVVVPDDALNLCVEIAVGQTNDKTLEQR